MMQTFNDFLREKWGRVVDVPAETRHNLREAFEAGQRAAIEQDFRKSENEEFDGTKGNCCACLFKYETGDLIQECKHHHDERAAKRPLHEKVLGIVRVQQGDADHPQKLDITCKKLLRKDNAQHD